MKSVICSNCGVEIKDPKVEKCPSCEDKYFDKPNIENKLFNLQDKWLETRDKKYLEKLYTLLEFYSRKNIRKYIKGGFSIKKEVLLEKSHDVAAHIIHEYLEKEDFMIQNSFSGYTRWTIYNFLYKDKKKDILEVSMDSIMDKTNSDFIDKNCEWSYKDDKVEDPDNLVYYDGEILLDRIMMWINVVYDLLKKEKPYLCSSFLLGVLNKLENDAFRMDIFYRIYPSSELRILLDNFFFEFYKELRYLIRNG